MSDMHTVTIKYSAFSNISFHGELHYDTDMSKEEWDALEETEQNDRLQEFFEGYMNEDLEWSEVE